MQTLAASMHSSISRCASLRTAGTTRTILPRMSNSSCVSTVSKSIAPRFSRAASSALNTAYSCLRCGSSGCASAGAASGSDSQDHTWLYVSRARECITAGKNR